MSDPTDLFAAIAEKVRGVRKILISSKDKGNHLAVVDILANRIATACGEHSSAFDRDQFREACGFTYNDQGYSYNDLEGDNDVW
jgi:hypothetical protein